MDGQNESSTTKGLGQFCKVVEPRRVNDKLVAKVGAVLDFMDRRQVLRRVVFLWMIYITTEALRWTYGFATGSPRPGLEVAAIIAAIWTPLGLLQGAIFKFYEDKS